MSQLILNKGVINKWRFLPKLQFGPYFLIASLILFVVLVTVTTLIFSTRQVTKGYVLNSLEASHQNLVRDSEVKDMQISKVRSLNYIKNSPKVLSMVHQRNIVFVNADSAIASK